MPVHTRRHNKMYMTGFTHIVDLANFGELLISGSNCPELSCEWTRAGQSEVTNANVAY